MHALVVVAHGSRREASNDEIRELALRLSAVSSDHFGQVTAAFLELADPLIPDAIVEAVDAGATRVTVLPYFLSAGRHVATDIPNEVEKAKQLRPEADIRVADYAGSSDAMLSLLLELATK